MPVAQSGLVTTSMPVPSTAATASSARAPRTTTTGAHPACRSVRTARSSSSSSPRRSSALGSPRRVPAPAARTTPATRVALSCRSMDVLPLRMPRGYPPARSGRPGAVAGKLQGTSQRRRPWSTGGKQPRTAARKPRSTPWSRHESRSSPEGRRGRSIPGRRAGGHVRGAAGGVPGASAVRRGGRGQARLGRARMGHSTVGRQPPSQRPAGRVQRGGRLVAAPDAFAAAGRGRRGPGRGSLAGRVRPALRRAAGPGRRRHDVAAEPGASRSPPRTAWLGPSGPGVRSRRCSAPCTPRWPRPSSRGTPGWCPSRRLCCRPRSVSAPSWGWTPRPWPRRRACGDPPYRRVGGVGRAGGDPAAGRGHAVRSLLGGARQHGGQALRQRVQLPLRWLPAPAAGRDVRRDGCQASRADGGHPRCLRREGHEGGHQHVHGPVPLPEAGQLHLLPGGEPALPEPVRRHVGVGGRAGPGRAGHARDRPVGPDPVLRGAQLRAQRHAGGVPAGREGPQGHDGLAVVRLTVGGAAAGGRCTPPGRRRPCRPRWPASASSPPPATTATAPG